MHPGPEPIGVFVKAVAFAADKHRNQRRKDDEASPYINHPIALANVLANEGGVTDVAVLSAAVLHDTIEDTETTSAELTAIFGPQVTAIVLEVTDDKTLEKDVRKQLQIEHAPHLSREAKLVKLADKICNLRDILASPPADWSPERKQVYFGWAAQVVAGVRGVHPELEAVFDGLVTTMPNSADIHLKPEVPVKVHQGDLMQYKKGDRVKHPKKPEWGIGQVLADSTDGTIRIFFAQAGEKTLALDFVHPELLSSDVASSPILDRLDPIAQPAKDAKGKVLCANCGAPTQFGDTANPKRYRLGWCEPCFKHSQRTFEDKSTGEKRYYDELRTIDGIKSRYSPH